LVLAKAPVLYQAEPQPENRFIARRGAPVTSRILIQIAGTERQGVNASAAVQFFDGWETVVPSMFIDIC
jgi:hypothetical protein